jgi:hypothetical protein
MNRYIKAAIIATFVFIAGGLAHAAENDRYIVLAWNTLGMHCYSSDFQDMAILPPYNTIWAQVIKVGEPPVIVTSGLIVEYSFRDNTYSAGKDSRLDKTNFWKYAKSLFGLDLPVNTGLTGKGLSGRMDLSGDHFVAEGIPLTEYRDSDVSDTDRGTWERHPYQLATIIVRDEKSGAELCRTSAVAPVSSEMNCGKCHGDDGIATKRNAINPTGKPQTNILALHDKLNGDKYKTALMASRPVLCASCHASNALGAKGVQGIPSLSNAIHRGHQDLPEITQDTAGCYSCHPGNRTQCLRDTMSTNYKLNCTTCHGAMSNVARNLEPWRVEPRCDNGSCHGQGYLLDKPLYGQSKAKTGVYCAGCHDSPHAIAPSRQESDQIKFKDLQGTPGTLRDCIACHGKEVTKPFKH